MSVQSAAAFVFGHVAAKLHVLDTIPKTHMHPTRPIRSKLSAMLAFLYESLSLLSTINNV